MSGSLKNRLFNYETTPPAGVWDDIQSVLDNDASSQKAKVIPLIYKRLTVAVIALVAVALTIFYLASPDVSKETREIASVVKNNFHLRPENTRIAVPSPAAALGAKLLKVPARKIGSNILIAKNIATPEEVSPEPEQNITETYFSDIKPVDADQPVNVPARPIRDAGGNIIMDLKLITKPDDPYITVTGPNGSQTKISNKFLGFLRYLNGDATDEDANYDETIWKDKFNSWREKLLNEDSFIPAASNFFDIFEMKDIIQE